jgi:ribosomal-protein-alanine N-acetyltransferase
VSRIALRDARAEQLGDVMAIMAEAFDPAFGEAWTAPQCSGILILPGVWMTLADLRGAPAGFTIARVVADEAELLLLAVRDGARRQGVGRALLHAFCEDAGRRGATRLHLEMRDGNAAAAMYRGAGFKQVGRRPNYYRGADADCFDAITLSRQLE